MEIKMEMEARVLAVQNIIGYEFKNKKLLEEALTHPSSSDAVSYERLEFIGDTILCTAISSHLYLVYPALDPGQLSLLRAANVSTEKLARVAVHRGLYHFVRHNSPPLVQSVKAFVDAVAQEDRPLPYGGVVKAPKVLADIVESVAAAVYVDLNFELKGFWLIIGGLLEPIVTPEYLEQEPQPVTMLFEMCQKKGKKVDIKHWRNGAKSIASVYVDGNFVTSASSDQKDIAKLDAAKIALHKLSHLVPVTVSSSNVVPDLDEDGSFVIEAAKHKLHELCRGKKWPKPLYSIERDSGPSHEKKFICSVQIANADGTFQMLGDEKSRVKDAENSAASLMIRALQEIICQRE